MKTGSKIPLGTLLAGAFTVALLTAPARGDVIMDWNARADAIGIEKQVPNAPNARAQAMLHVAMFEAVNAIDKRYAPYKLTLMADRTASKEAAAVAAAHGVLVALYPDQKADLDAALSASLSAIAETEAKSKGIETGKKAAAEIIALRADDGSAGKLPPFHGARNLRADHNADRIHQFKDDALGDEHRFAVPPGTAASTQFGDLDQGPERDPRNRQQHQH